MVWLWVEPFWWPTGVLSLPDMISEDLDQPDSIVRLSRRNCQFLSSFRLTGTAGLGWGQQWAFHFPSPSSGRPKWSLQGFLVQTYI